MHRSSFWPEVCLPGKWRRGRYRPGIYVTGVRAAPGSGSGGKEEIDSIRRERPERLRNHSCITSLDWIELDTVRVRILELCLGALLRRFTYRIHPHTSVIEGSRQGRVSPPTRIKWLRSSIFLITLEKILLLHSKSFFDLV